MTVRPATARTMFSLAPAFALAWLFCGCTTPKPQAIASIGQYIAAVQALDIDALYCLSAGVASAEELGADPSERRQNFESWINAQVEVYLEGRDEGWVELDGHGPLLVKLYVLGRGTFLVFGPVRTPNAETRVIRADLRFGYAQIDLNRFSPGTTFYMNGVPPGRIHPIVVPRWSREVTVDVLESISVEWTLIRTLESEACPAGWAVASAVPIPDTEVSTELSLEF